MGLDQYLYASRYSSEMFNKESYQDLLGVLGEEIDAFADKDIPSITVKVKVGYWRKANQIHNWFVENIQRGEDNCGEYYVSREALAELLSTCETVLKEKDNNLVSVGEELLPTTSGFFFGSTEYDEWYIGDVEFTRDLISKLLKEVPDSWEFYYSSSW